VVEDSTHTALVVGIVVDNTAVATETGTAVADNSHRVLGAVAATEQDTEVGQAALVGRTPDLRVADVDTVR